MPDTQLSCCFVLSFSSFLFPVLILNFLNNNNVFCYFICIYCSYEVTLKKCTDHIFMLQCMIHNDFLIHELIRDVSLNSAVACTGCTLGWVCMCVCGQLCHWLNSALKSRDGYQAPVLNVLQATLFKAAASISSQP